MKGTPVGWLLPIVVFVCSGCFPYHYTERPEIVGRVLDATTHKPIDQTDVTVDETEAPWKSKESISLKTATDGTFCVPSKCYWGIVIFIMPFDPPAVRHNLEVRHAGYETTTRTLWRSVMDSSIKDFGEILLQPSPVSQREVPGAK